MVVEGLPFSGKGVCINMIRTVCKAEVKCVTVKKHPPLAEVCSKPGQNALTFLFNMLFEYCKPALDSDIAVVEGCLGSCIEVYMKTFHRLKWISNVELDLLHRWATTVDKDIPNTTEYLFVESSQDTCMSRSIDSKQLLDNSLIQHLLLAYQEWLRACTGQVIILDGNMNTKNNDIERQIHLKMLTTKVNALADHFVIDTNL